MPVYHFVLHAYGTWHPDHERGWHQHGDPYPLRTDIPLGKYRRKTQRWDSASFPTEFQRPLLEMVLDICRRREWRCHTTAITETHIHIVASWHVKFEAIDAQHIFKRLLGWRLAKFNATEGRRWFSDGGKPKRVRDLAHLRHLVDEYLPNQGGAFWSELPP